MQKTQTTEMHTMQVSKETLDPIINCLEGQIVYQGYKYLYLSRTDWSIYEMSLPEALRKVYRQVGYNRAINPASETEQYCLPYKNYPVFRL